MMSKKSLGGLNGKFSRSLVGKDNSFFNFFNGGLFGNPELNITENYKLTLDICTLRYTEF